MATTGPVTQYRQPVSSPQYSDASAVKLIKSKAISRIQNVASGVAYPVSNADLYVYPQSVGLIKRLYVVLEATLTNTSGTNVSHLTDNGLANLLSNVRFYDTNQLLRHDTSGLHLTLVSTAKRYRPFAGNSNWNTANGNSVASMFNVAPSSWMVLEAPPTIAVNSSATVRAMFEIPLAYSDKNFNGILFAQSVNATMSLYLQFNQNAFVDTTTTPTLDDTFAVYNGSAGTFTSCNWTVYQDYYDQLPRDFSKSSNIAGAPYILPEQSISNAYMLTRSTVANIVQGAEASIAYQNFRAYMSRFIIYNSTGQHNGRNFGTDLQYIREIAGNNSPYFQYDPLFSAFRTREIMQIDLPAGIYYLPARHNPIYTTQTGNRLTSVLPLSATSGAYITVYDEYIGNQNVIKGAASAV